MKTDIRDRGAAALDTTHALDHRGPRTYMARSRVAEALDLGKKPAKIDIEWLESIKNECPLCHGYGVVGVGQHPDGSFDDFAPCPRGCENGLEE
jgi:hypothetical protein